MLSIQNTENFRIESPTVVTIGTFDGVHLGHQKILLRLHELKEETGLQTVVFTFEPHPRKVLFPEQQDLKLLSLTDEKLELFEKYKVDVAVVYPFDKAFSEMEPKFYIEEILVKQMHVKKLVIGYDHKFGRDRTGDIHTLKKYAPDYNYSVEEISAQDIDHISVSSSKIRKSLEEGNLTLASEYLGHRYFMNATVTKGKQLGRTLGYPTANLKTETDDKLIPKTGIYFVEVSVEQHKHFGMMSIGINPTTDHDNKIKCEVHIFDFHAEIYSKNICVSFLKRIRDEKKFSNLTELKEAIDVDKKTCMKLIKDLYA